MPPRRLVALIVLGFLLVVPRAPGLEAPRAEAPLAAVSRSGVLGGADYLIEVPANCHGGLVVFAHGIQRGPGPGAVEAPPLAAHIVDEGHAWIASGYRALEYQPHLFMLSYRRRNIAAGTDRLLVQRVLRGGGHCAFDGEMREQAFDDLVGWIERGVRPQGEDVLAPDLSRVGLQWTPALHPDDPLFVGR
jgi:hypothetical protein